MNLSLTDGNLNAAVNDNSCWRKLFKRDNSRAYKAIESAGKWFTNSSWQSSYLYDVRMVCFGTIKILPREIIYTKVNSSCIQCVSTRSVDCTLFFDPLFFQKPRISLLVGQIIIAFFNVYGVKTPKLGKITKVSPRISGDEPFVEIRELKLENSKLLEMGSFTVPSQDPNSESYVDSLVITNILLNSGCSHTL